MMGIPFGSVADFRNGVNYSANDVGPKVKVIGVGDFGSRSEFSDFAELDAVTLPSLQVEDLLQQGDLLFVRSNGNKKLIGRCMLIGRPEAPVTHSGFTIRARVDRTKYLPEFVGAVFQTDGIHKQAHLQGTGTNISNLSQRVLAEVSLPAIGITQQLVCLETFALWDKAVRSSGELCSALECRRQGLMQRLLTGRQRLKGFRKSWQTYRLHDLFAEVTRRASTSVPVLSISAGRGFLSQKERFNREVSAATLANYTLLERGEFAYNKGNSKTYTCGCTYALTEFEAAAIPSVYISFRATSPINTRFFEFFFEADRLKAQLTRIINSGVRNDGLLNLATKDFFNMQIQVPDLSEQAAIADVLDHAAESVRLQRQQLQALQQQKRALLQRLLSGDPA